MATATRKSSNGFVPFTAPGLSPKDGTAVATILQNRLNALGFETGGSDGRFGARTYEAILAYQKKNGLPLDGVPSVKLLQSLQKNS